LTILSNTYFDSKILIVDDQPANVTLLETMLSLAGYANVDSTSDPRLVIELYERNRYDLLLLDINMPHIRGLEIMEKLSVYMGDGYMPVLVITARDDMKTHIQALKLGTRDFITKPFEFDHRLFPVAVP